MSIAELLEFLELYLNISIFIETIKVITWWKSAEVTAYCAARIAATGKI